MRTVQMTLNESLVQEVDKVAKKLRTTRSGFARRALQEAIKRIRDMEKDQRFREGYRRHPVEPGEFEVAEEDLRWGD